MRFSLLTRGVAAVVLVAVLAGCGSTYKSSGVIYYRQKNWAKAVEQLTLAVQQNPKDFESQLDLAISLAELNRFPEAAPHFQAAHEATPDPRKKDEVKLHQEHYRVVAYNEGVRLMKENDFAGAIQSLKHATEVWPEEPQAYRLMGYLYGTVKTASDEEKKANLDTAVTTLRKATELEPGHVATWLDLAAMLRRAARWDEATQAYEEALKHNPNDEQKAECYSRMGDVKFNDRDYAGAIALYTRAIEARPDEPQVHYMAGLASFNQQKYAEAADFFAQAAQYCDRDKEPEVFRDATYKMGVASLEGGNFQRAIEAANTLLADQETVDGLRLRGQAKTRLANQLEEKNQKADADRLRAEGLEDLKKANEQAGG